MAERVDIMVVATDGASQVLRGVTSQFGQLGSVIQGITSGRGLEVLTEQAISFGKESVKSFTEGAQAAKQLSQISGTSIEDASRFIQVLDDFGLTQQDALTATRALTKEGLEPSLATLSKLSEQYKAIQDPQKQNEFILKNLGRAGLEWVKVLNQEKGALEERGAAVSKNLIFTEKMYEDAEKLRFAQDDLNDSWEETKVQMGSAIVPVLSTVINHVNALNRAEQQLQEEGLRPGTKAYEDRKTELIASIKAEQEFKQSVDDTTGALDASTEATDFSKEAAEWYKNTIEAATEKNKSYLSSLTDVTQSNLDYKSKLTSLITEHGKLIVEKQNLIAQGYRPEGETIMDITQKIKDNEQAQKENADNFELQSHRRIIAALEEYAMKDGLTDQEVAFLQNLQKQYGLTTDADIAALKREQDEIARYKKAIDGLPDQHLTKIITEFTNIGNAPGGDLASIVSVTGRAGGGDVSAGSLYRVNETRTEYFRPAMSGTVVPLGGNGAGGNINITVHYSALVSSDADRGKLLPMIINGVKEAKAQGMI